MSDIEEQNRIRNQAAQSLLEQTLKGLGSQLAEMAKRELTRDMVSRMSYGASEVVTSYAKEWMRENVLPEVTAQLEAQKPQLIATVLAGIHAGCRQLACALEAHAAKRMANSWNMRTLIKEVFGD